MTATSLSVALTQARKRAGLSQAELARRLNEGREMVWRWETGRAVPTFEQVVRWSDVTRTPLEAFKGDMTSSVTGQPQTASHAADPFASLTTEDAQTLRRICLALAAAADLALDARATSPAVPYPPDAGTPRADDDE